MGKGNRERRDAIRQLAEQKAKDRAEESGTPSEAPQSQEPTSELAVTEPQVAAAVDQVQEAEKPTTPIAAAAEGTTPAPAAQVLQELGGKASGEPKPLTRFGKLDRLPNRKRKSEMQGPVALVWHIADQMIDNDPTVRRRDVIKECIKQGVADYTARTQYQQWYTARRESQKNAAKVQAEQAAGKLG